MGTATIAHATATVKIPAQQGLWAVFEIFVDTIIVCTMTALVILVSGTWSSVDPHMATQMPAIAFEQVLGSFGGGLVAFSILMFVLSTVIVIIFYGEKQAYFLFGTRKASYVMRVIYLAFIVMAVIFDLAVLYKLLDFMLALVVIPNMIGIILMSGEAVEMKNQLFNNPEYYPGAKK